MTTEQKLREALQAALKFIGEPAGVSPDDLTTQFFYELEQRRQKLLAQMHYALSLPTQAEPVEGGEVALQDFQSPRGKILMSAWQEGWASCRDSEFVGHEAMNDAFNRSKTVNHCAAEDMLYTAPQPAAPALVPLTDSRIMSLAEDLGVIGPRSRVGKLHTIIGPFARAVERAHGIGQPVGGEDGK